MGFTVLLMPNGPQKITGLPFIPEQYKSEHSVEDLEIQKLLKTSANPKAAKKKKKAAEKAVTEETVAAPISLRARTDKVYASGWLSLLREEIQSLEKATTN